MSEKDNLKKYLEKLKINESAEDARNKFESQIGFKKEKKKFVDYVYLYAATKGNFRPSKQVVCYAGAPGTGKTTFINTLRNATGRDLQLISCAGLGESSEYSILGDENKPSLVVWAILKSECKNPIISFDELEKVKDEQVQKDLIELFKMYKEDQELFDPYYQMSVKLDHISFFATVNYPDKLALLLKEKVEMRELEDYSDEDKKKILELKSKKIHENYGEKDGIIIPNEIIKELPKHIQEAGVRQTERVLYKILEKFICAKEEDQKFSLGDPKKWLKDNVLPYQESFQPSLRHYSLFVLWGITWVLLLLLIIKKLILKKKNNKK